MFKLGNHEIKQNNRSFVIAEVGQAHDGSLGFAHSYIDLAAKCGADAVKFQTHIASAESTHDEPFRVKFSKQDATRYDYWKRMEFTAEQWAGIAEHCREKNLAFLSSAFSIEAVNLLEALDMPAWKVGSGEFRSVELMETMSSTGKPILLSTGMSRYNEIDDSVSWFRQKGLEFGLFQCTSMYPTPHDKVGLNVIDELYQKYKCPVGLSDHSGTPIAPIAAIAQGAAMIEVHIVFDKGMFGPDVPASLTTSDLSLVCKARDNIAEMNINPVNKDALADELGAMREMFSKSIALSGTYAKGTVLAEEMMVPRKPGTGLPYKDRHKYVGKILKNEVLVDRLLKNEDISE